MGNTVARMEEAEEEAPNAVHDSEVSEGVDLKRGQCNATRCVDGVWWSFGWGSLSELNSVCSNLTWWHKDKSIWSNLPHSKLFILVLYLQTPNASNEDTTREEQTEPQEEEEEEKKGITVR